MKTNKVINDIVSLAKEIISITSATGEVDNAALVLEVAKKQLEGNAHTSFVSSNIPSLLYSNKGKDVKNFKIILNAHLDVVPGKKEQFQPYEKDGKIYGRGAYDTKAGTAVMIMLFKELAPQLDFPLALQLTTDEELGGVNGTKYQIDQGIRGDFVIATECGSNFHIVHEAKARLVVKLVAKGKTSHSAYPWAGDNA